MTWSLGLLGLVMAGIVVATYWRLSVYSVSESEEWMMRVRQLSIRENGHGHD